MSDLLQTEVKGRVLHVTLNRPDKRNALNEQLCHDIIDTINQGNHDQDIGAVVLTANGPVFCAGMDLHEIGHVDEETMGHLHEQLFTMGSRLGKPLVGGVDGPALGGGFGLVANCNIVVASSKAQFGLTEVRIGLWPFLVQRAGITAVGERRFVELALTGRIIESPEAQSMGLIQEINEDPAGKAMEIGEKLANFSLNAVRGGLNFVQEVRGEDPEMAGMLGRNARKELFEHEDFQEGLRAFREKRDPVWPSLARKQHRAGEEQAGDETP